MLTASKSRPVAFSVKGLLIRLVKYYVILIYRMTQYTCIDRSLGGSESALDAVLSLLFFVG